MVKRTARTIARLGVLVVVALATPAGAAPQLDSAPAPLYGELVEAGITFVRAVQQGEAITYVQALQLAEVNLYVLEVERAELATYQAEVARQQAAARSALANSQRPTPAPSGGVITGDVWWSLALCESGGTNANTGNGFYGYFQFMPSTWNGIGYPGLPTDHGYETQRAAAQALQARSGWGQWPACSSKLGLR